MARLTALLEGQLLLGREPSPSTPSPSPPSTGEGASPPPPETPRRIGSNVLLLDSPSPGPRGSSASDAAFSGYDDALGPSDDPPPSAVALPPRPQPAPEIEYRSYSQGQVDAMQEELDEFMRRCVTRSLDRFQNRHKGMQLSSHCQ